MNRIKPPVLRFILFFFVVPGASFAQTSAGWRNLFDGKTLTGWHQAAGKAEFKVENGAITSAAVSNSVNSFLVTDKEYSDFILEADVMLEDPTGNSGIQVRSHFDPEGGHVFGRQVEVDPTPRAWSGGVYDEARRQWLYPMDLNEKAKNAYKPGVFNHIKVECIGNVMKTWFNGVPAAYVVDTVDRSGFIGLQTHTVSSKEKEGKRVFFKNIRIKTIGLVPQPFLSDAYVVNFRSNTLTAYEKQHGWSLLFDGKTPAGWRAAFATSFPAKGWRTSGGTLTVLSSEGKESANGGDIVTLGQYSAFDLSFEFKLTPGANSGVKYFVSLKEKSDASAIGLEYQVLDDELHPDAKLGRDGNRTLASLYDLITAQKQPRFTHKIGEWNTGRVVVYPAGRVEHYLNGLKVLEYKRGSKEYSDLVALSKYKIWPGFGMSPSGHILLQDHGNEVSYRSIKIKKLTSNQTL